MAVGALINENSSSTSPTQLKPEIIEVPVEKIVEKEKIVYVYVEKGKYGIQIGSFLSKKFANKLKNRLKNQYAINIKEEKYGAKTYQVVFAEGFPSLDLAKKAKDHIDQKEEVSSIILKRF